MAYNVRQISRDQLFLLPPSLSEWLPKPHLAWTIIDVVSEMDLSSFYTKLRLDGKGASSYPPEVMVAIVLYAFCVGERSSHKIESKLITDIAFRVVGANSSPDHATVARFLVRFENELGQLFSQVLGLCIKAGIVDTSLVAIDGTKILADASEAKSIDTKKLAKLIVGEAIKTNKCEDELFGDKRGDELPEVLNDKEWIKKALVEVDSSNQKRIEEHKVPNDHRAYLNVTDPDARLMKTRTGIKFAYNGQAIATQNQVIIAAEVSQSAADVTSFSEVVNNACFELTEHSKAIGQLLGDCGYWSAPEIAVLNVEEVLMPIPSQVQDITKRSDLHEITYLFNKCDQGRLSHRKAALAIGISKSTFGRLHRRYKLDKKVGLMPFIMANKLLDERNKKLLAKRKTIIEPIFGQMKHNRGFRTLRRRGLNAAESEWKLMAATHNLLKLHQLRLQPLTTV